MGRRRKSGRGSLKYQLKNKLKNMWQKGYGMSRHEAKIKEKEIQKSSGERYNTAVEGLIYDDDTYKSYKSINMRFADWVRQEDPKVKDIEDIKKEHIEAFLKKHQNGGKSKWTLKTYRSALCKVYETKSNQLNVNIGVRKNNEIKRSRQEKDYNKNINMEKNHPKLHKFLAGTGLRKSEALKMKPENIYKDNKGNVKVLVVRGKGGKMSERKVIGFKEDVLKLKKERSGHKRLFDRIPKNLDVHGDYRRTYAQELYKEYAKPIEEIKGQKIIVNGVEKNRVYWERGNSQGNRVFDRHALLMVSKNLSHILKEEVVTEIERKGLQLNLWK